MSLGYLGPVKVDFHGDPSFRFTSKPDAMRARGVEISGRFDWQVAEQLSELVENTDAAPTTGDRKGVLVPVWAGDAKLSQFVGWYVLESCELAGSQRASLTEPDVVMQGVYLGQAPEVTIPRWSVPKGNGYGLAAKSLVVSPFRPGDVAGDRFLVDPGGAFFTRAYDPSYPYATDSPTPAGSARIGMYTGTVTDSTDELVTVCLPRLAWSKTAPKWITDQGGNVRAFDRRAMREVYGPKPFLETTDILVTNGLLTFWVGNRGLVPFLTVQAFDGISRREMGYIFLADVASDDTLIAARVETLTSEMATVVLTVLNKGDVRVSLFRGERQLRCTGVDQARWSGVPPWSRLERAAQDDGKFGLGLATEEPGGGPGWGDAGAGWGDAEVGWAGSPSLGADFRLRWPPSVPAKEHTLAWWFRAGSPSPGGQWTVYGEDDLAAIKLDFAAGRFRERIGALTLTSPVQSFAGGTDIILAARLSPTDGTVLSVKAGAAAMTHSKNPATATGTLSDGYSGISPGVSDTAWGDGSWGDGTWGGILYADGVQSQLMLFDRYLSDVELEELAAATERFDGLPDPEAALVWVSTFDPRPILFGSAVATGSRFESTAQAGGVRHPDRWGFTRALSALSGAGDTDGLALNGADLAAVVATTAINDDVADHHAQAAAENRQEVRVR